MAERIKDVEEGEYERVCGLIEKSVYGGEELRAFEERALRSFIRKLEAEIETLPKRRCFAARSHCVKCCFMRMKHRQKHTKYSIIVADSTGRGKENDNSGML